MIRFYRLNNLCIIVMLIFLTFSCSYLGIQSKKQTPKPSTLLECEKNFTKEGIWPINRVYKTWVKYSPLDYKKGFDTAVMAVKASGYRTISAERESGIINAEIISVIEDRKPYPVEIKLIKEKSSLTVHLSSPSATDDSGKECFCGFYNEFEKLVKRPHPAPVAKQAPPPAKKSVEPEKDSSPPPPPPAVETPKTSSPPPPPPKALRDTEVLWRLVNLREGPGMNYKVVDTVKRGTSLAILGEKSEWLHVLTEDGKEVWIIKKATSEKREASAAPASPPPKASSSASSPPSLPSPSASTPVESAKPKSPM